MYRVCRKGKQIYVEYRKDYLLTIREIKKMSGAAARTGTLMEKGKRNYVKKEYNEY